MPMTSSGGIGSFRIGGAPIGGHAPRAQAGTQSVSVPPPLLLVLRRRTVLARPPDVLAAIADFWEADAALAGFSPGLVLTMGPLEPEPPMATYFVVSENEDGKNTGVGYWEDRVIQLNLWDDDDARLALAEAAVQASYDPLQQSKALDFGNGYLMRFQRVGGGGPVVTPRKTRSGTRVIHRWFTYRVWAGRNVG
jgi:hypothetical protein